MAFLNRRGVLFAGTAAWLWSRRANRSLTHKVVLITGGSRGLGLELARRFVARGARVGLCARDPAELERARAGLVAAGGEVFVRTADLTRSEEAEGFVEEAVDRWGAVDVLVNNAGIIEVGPLENFDLDDLRRVMEFDFWSAVHTTLAALPYLKRARGRIANITSIGGIVSVPHLLPYNIAKFAFVGFSTGIAAELARHGIRVLTVVPGLMRTGSFVNAQVRGRREGEAMWFSVGASLPFLAMNSGRAADQIVRAVERGDRWLTVGLPAKALRLGSALLPGVTTGVLGVVNRILPKPGEGRSDRAARHRTGLADSWVTTLGDRAARENNEVVPQRRPFYEPPQPHA